MSSYDDVNEIFIEHRPRQGGSYRDYRSNSSASSRRRSDRISGDHYSRSSRNRRARSPRGTTRLSRSPSRTPPRHYTRRSHREPASDRPHRKGRNGRAHRRSRYSPPQEEPYPLFRARREASGRLSPSPSPPYSEHRRRKVTGGSPRYARRRKPQRGESQIAGDSRRITPSYRPSQTPLQRSNRLASPQRSSRRREGSNNKWPKRERLHSRSAGGGRLFHREDRPKRRDPSAEWDRAPRDSSPVWAENRGTNMPRKSRRRPFNSDNNRSTSPLFEAKDKRSSRHRRKKSAPMNGVIHRSRHIRGGAEPFYRKPDQAWQNNGQAEPSRHRGRRGSKTWHSSADAVSRFSKSPSPSKPYSMVESEMEYLKGEISRQGSTMNALRARIQELHSERDELEVTAQWMRTIERELAREKQSFNKLVLTMNETKAKALEIQEREVRAKKIAAAQEELKKSQVEASTWSSRIQNLEAQLNEMGVSNNRAPSPSPKVLEPPPNGAFRQHQPIQNSMVSASMANEKEYHVGGDRHYASSQSDSKYSEEEQRIVPPKPKQTSVYTTASEKEMQEFMRVLRSIPGFKNNRKCQQDIQEVMRAFRQKLKWKPNVSQMQAMMEMLQRAPVNGRR